MANNEPQKG